jgi:glycosyltransferase involved in cell wall biosynthesis
MAVAPLQAPESPLVLFGMTSGVSARGFIGGQGPFLRERGWRVALACADEGGVRDFAHDDGLDFHPVAVARNPSLRADLRGAGELWRLVRRLHPSVTVWGSPKASLLGVLVTRAQRVPSLYLIHGLRLEGASGLRRAVLWLAEAATCRLASQVVADGYELRDLATRLHLVPPHRVDVLADGSANGVPTVLARPRYRHELGLGADDVLVTFAGRITGDKGVRELAAAWRRVAPGHPAAHLVVAGRVDGPDPHGPGLEAELRRLPRTHLVGHVDDLDRLWADSDLCVLPSHREGLPLVVIEAAAAGVPAVVTDCTGGREVVVDGGTGLVVPRRDPERLADALDLLLGDPAERRRLGNAARERAVHRYHRPRLWAALDATLRRLARAT